MKFHSIVFLLVATFAAPGVQAQDTTIQPEPAAVPETVPAEPAEDALGQ